MHIPDGCLDPKISAGLGLAAATAVSYALNKVREALTSPVLATAAATIGRSVRSIATKTKQGLNHAYAAKLVMIASVIFTAQLFDFQILSGTTGHLFGGVLAVVFLGPWGGMLAMASVIAIQALFMADGGICALGANIVNMAVLGSAAMYFVYLGLKKIQKSPYIAMGLAALLSLVIVAMACTIEGGFSGVTMVKVHFIIGFCEACATVAVTLFLQKFLNWELF